MDDYFEWKCKLRKNISKSVGADNYITNSEVIFVDQKIKKLGAKIT